MHLYKLLAEIVGTEMPDSELHVSVARVLAHGTQYRLTGENLGQEHAERFSVLLDLVPGSLAQIEEAWEELKKDREAYKEKFRSVRLKDRRQSPRERAVVVEATPEAVRYRASQRRLAALLDKHVRLDDVMPEGWHTREVCVLCGAEPAVTGSTPQGSDGDNKPQPEAVQFTGRLRVELLAGVSAIARLATADEQRRLRLAEGAAVIELRTPEGGVVVQPGDRVELYRPADR